MARVKHNTSNDLFLSDCKIWEQTTYAQETIKLYNPDIDVSSLILTKECIYQPHYTHQKIKNAKVLIIGGGPSTLRYNWNWNDYDIVCSVNNFIVNQSISPYVDFALIMRKSNTNDILQKTNATLIIVKSSKILNIKEIDTTRYFYMLPRYWSHLGAASTLLVIMTLLGAQTIHIVGMDGYPKESNKVNYLHAFIENDKPPKYYSYSYYYDLYKKLWNYLKYKIGQNIKYVNLGYGHPYNISSHVLDDKGNWLF